MKTVAYSSVVGALCCNSGEQGEYDWRLSDPAGAEMSDLPVDDLDGDGLPQSGGRLQILSAGEYELLWGFPHFTQSDRDLFFTLSAREREALEQRRSVRTKIHFLLHLGYFRARQRFFRFELAAVRDDVDYLRRRYFDNQAVAELTVSDHTGKRHVEAILGLFRYRLCALDERLLLEARARQVARISSRPVSVLRELVDLLRRERVVLPGYTVLQNIVRAALVRAGPGNSDIRIGDSLAPTRPDCIN